MRRMLTHPGVGRGAARRPGLSRAGVVEPPGLEAQFEELLAVVSAMHEMLKQLLELAQDKLAAMRGADAAELQRCAVEECGVLERLFAQECRRDAVLARVAQSLPGEYPPQARLSEIAERLPEPFCSRLRARTAGMRRTIDELRRRNRVAAEVARHLHEHIRAVFEDVARVNQQSVVYGPSGRHEQRTKETWVDAIG